MERERYEDVVDATRRTRLASERTYLAWWRSALAAFAVSLGVGKLVPELTSGRTIGYEIVGVGYATARDRVHRLRRSGGSTCWRARSRDVRAFERWAAIGFTAAGVVLGIATLVVIIV